VSREKPRNLAASVRQKLFSRAQERREDFGLVLTKYGLERFLYRLSRSEYRDQFVLKGAPTVPTDTGLGPLGARRQQHCPNEESLRGCHRPSCRRRWIGFRPHLCSDNQDSLQVDIGFGDAIVPDPEEIQYPGMLDFPVARLRAYRKETVVAEKLEALVKLGMVNTRMKDFYDLWILAREFEFSGPALCKDIEATFHRRQTEIPPVVPLALTQEFFDDPQKRTQWQAFVKKSSLEHHGAELDGVIAEMRKFLLPPVKAIRTSEPFKMSWPKNGPWAHPKEPIPIEI
jgi:Nucleotidyl transferase AbiEii toxin, Type IV TA system